MINDDNDYFRILNLPKYLLFWQYINNEYKPFRSEFYGEKDKLLFKYPFFSMVNARRFYLTLKYFNLYFPKNGSKAIDIGGYPGSILKIIRKYSNHSHLSLYQCGLYNDSEFMKEMGSYDITMLPLVDIDPPICYQKELEEKNNFLIGMDNETVDFVIATEIIEHLVYPLHFLSEAKRILKPGGRILITTPNIAKSSAWVRVLLGKSNLDPLEKTQIFMQGNWRGHVRLYSKQELITLLKISKFNVLAFKAFNDGYYEMTKTSILRKIDFTLRLVIELIFPWTKPELLVIAEKSL